MFPISHPSNASVVDESRDHNQGTTRIEIFGVPAMNNLAVWGLDRARANHEFVQFSVNKISPTNC